MGFLPHRACLLDSQKLSARDLGQALFGEVVVVVGRVGRGGEGRGVRAGETAGETTINNDS